MSVTEIAQLIAATLGSIGFSIVFNIPKDKLQWAALGGFLDWCIYLVFQHLGFSEYACGFLAAALATIYSEVVARISKTPAIIYIVISTVALIPGAALYRTMNALLHREMAEAQAQGIYALLFAACMAAGIVIASLAEKAVFEHRASSFRQMFRNQRINMDVRK